MVFGNKNLSKYEVKLYKHSKKTTNYKFQYALQNLNREWRQMSRVINLNNTRTSNNTSVGEITYWGAFN